MHLTTPQPESRRHSCFGGDYDPHAAPKALPSALRRLPTRRDITLNPATHYRDGWAGATLTPADELDGMLRPQLKDLGVRLGVFDAGCRRQEPWMRDMIRREYALSAESAPTQNPEPPTQNPEPPTQSQTALSEWLRQACPGVWENMQQPRAAPPPRVLTAEWSDNNRAWLREGLEQLGLDASEPPRVSEVRKLQAQVCVLTEQLADLRDAVASLLSGSESLVEGMKMQDEEQSILSARLDIFARNYQTARSAPAVPSRAQCAALELWTRTRAHAAKTQYRREVRAGDTQLACYIYRASPASPNTVKWSIRAKPDFRFEARTGFAATAAEAAERCNAEIDNWSDHV
jgi:hypothetical protein